VNDNDRR